MSDHDVRILIETCFDNREWSWEVTIDGDSWYGFEPDYLNAEGQVRDLLREVLHDE